MHGAAHSSPPQVPTLDAKAGAQSQDSKNSTFIHPGTQTSHHTPLTTLAPSPPLLKVPSHATELCQDGHGHLLTLLSLRLVGTMLKF